MSGGFLCRHQKPMMWTATHCPILGGPSELVQRRADWAQIEGRRPLKLWNSEKYAPKVMGLCRNFYLLFLLVLG